MARRIALAALVRKRAELAGRVEHAYAGLERMLADLAGLDTTLRLFDPDIRLDAIKPRDVRLPYGWAKPNHIATRAVLNVLRLAPGPVTTADITSRVLADMGADGDDPKAWELATERVGEIMRMQRRWSVARSISGEGQQLLWELAGE